MKMGFLLEKPHFLYDRKWGFFVVENNTPAIPIRLGVKQKATQQPFL
jgi:hypothetical protein